MDQRGLTLLANVGPFLTPIARGPWRLFLEFVSQQSCDGRQRLIRQGLVDTNETRAPAELHAIPKAVTVEGCISRLLDNNTTHQAPDLYSTLGHRPGKCLHRPVSQGERKHKR